MPSPEPIYPFLVEGVAALNRRHRVYLEAGGVCTYCTGEMTYTPPHGRQGYLDPHEVTIEHLKAKSQGGSNLHKNLAGACVACNNSKADEMPAEAFRAMRQRLLAEWPPCTFPPLSVRRREPGIRAITKRFQTVFKNVSNTGYWRWFFAGSATLRWGLVWDNQAGTLAVKRRELLEHLPGRAKPREEVLWRWGPFRRLKLIKGRSAAYEDHDWLFDYGSLNPWRECVDTAKSNR